MDKHNGKIANKDAQSDWEDNSQELFKLGQQVTDAWWDKFGNQSVTANFEEMFNHWTVLWQDMMNKPEVFLQNQLAWFNECAALWQATTNAWLGQETMDLPEVKDKRFKNESWNEHPGFQWIKQSYLTTVKHVDNWIGQIECQDAKKKQQVQFQARALLNALSPSNFISTNPEVLKLTLEEKGQNLIDGMKNMLEDMERSGEVFSIKMTDLDAFKVGENVATSKGAVVFENELFQLIQYSPLTDTVFKTPLLIMPPWINKYYILDLTEKNSFVNYALRQGHTVFMISWVNPNESHREINFEDYLTKGALKACEEVLSICKTTQLNTVGFCIGGTLNACLNSYLQKKKKDIIKSSTYFATMLDFSEPGELGVFIDEEKVNSIEADMQPKGFLEGSKLALIFNLLRDNDLIWSYFTNNYLKGQQPMAFDLLYWNCDSTNLPYAMQSYYLRNMYLNNDLIKANKLAMGGEKLDLTAITTPSFFISTELDHIAPWKSTYMGASQFKGEVEFVLGGSGHIAGIINPPEKNKYGYKTASFKALPGTADEWLSETKAHEGSWWPHWQAWMKPFLGDKKIKARTIKKARFIEEAPGSYVGMKVVNKKVVQKQQEEEYA